MKYTIAFIAGVTTKSRTEGLQTMFECCKDKKKKCCKKYKKSKPCKKCPKHS